MTVISAFIDDSGNTDIDLRSNPGATKHYILTAVIVDDRDILRFNILANKIKSAHFGSGEMKGSRIGGDVSRRNKILNDLYESPFKFYSIIYDKIQLSDGVFGNDRLSFYSNCMFHFLKKIKREVGLFNGEIDEFGNDQFRSSFINSRFFHDNRLTYGEIKTVFRPSFQSLGIQVADIISNSLFQIYENKLPPHNLSALKKKDLNIEIYPPRSISAIRHYRPESRCPNDQWDDLIARYCLGLTHDYVSNNQHSDDRDVIARCCVVRHLRAVAISENHESYVKSNGLIKCLRDRHEIEMSTNEFMNKVIAPLRDEGVIIATSNHGYKLPTSFVDIEEYVKKVIGETLPYLVRLQRARRGLRNASGNALDITSGLEFSVMDKMLRYLESENVELFV